MATTKLFRDRVVSLEQTFEIGEKHLELLTEIAEEALPGFKRADHELEHERDLFVMVLKDPEADATKRISFTRMVLADSSCLPAVQETGHGPARARLLQCIRLQAGSAEIAVTFRGVMNEEDRTEADQVEAEWHKKQEAILAARRAEEARREEERRRQRRQEEARRAAQRAKDREARAPGGAPAAGQKGRTGPRDRSRRGAPGGAQPHKGVGGTAPVRGQERTPGTGRQQGPPGQRAAGPRGGEGPPRSPVESKPGLSSSAGPAPSVPGPAGPAPGAPVPGPAGSGRRRRRRGRGGRGRGVPAPAAKG